MRAWRGVTWVVLLSCVGGSAWVLTRLYQLRLAEGDIYPAYSSKRADPLGTRAYHDSLARLGGLRVERNFRPFEEVRDPRHSAFLYLGSAVDELWDQRSLDAFERLSLQGGRLVVTFYPVTSGAWGSIALRNATNQTAPPTVGTGPRSPGDRAARRRALVREKVGGNEDASDEPFGWGPVLDRWGVTLQAVADEGLGAAAQGVIAERSPEPGPPVERLRVRSRLRFAVRDPEWQVIYAVEDEAVVLERKHGHGSLVLAADSYFVSNEALRDDRCAGLLAWMIGAHRTVVFDELHLGLEEQTGIAALGKKYGLEWVAAALLLVAGLFVWKNSVPLVPATETPSRRETPTVMGRDAAAGFLNLLRRGIAAEGLLRSCFIEWKRSQGPLPPEWRERVLLAEALVKQQEEEGAARRDVTAVYRDMVDLLSRRPRSSRRTTTRESGTT